MLLNTSPIPILYCAAIQLCLQYEITEALFLNRSTTLSLGEAEHVLPHSLISILTAKTKKSHRRPLPPQNLYPPEEESPPPGDDYFASYDTDYANPPIGNISSLIYDGGNREPAIFPNPEMMIYDSERNNRVDEIIQGPQTVDVLPDVELPDEWLPVADLNDRGAIDSVNYVYYGSNGAPSGGQASGVPRKWASPILLGVGVGAIVLVATSLALLYKKRFRSSKMFPIEMNLLSCFLVTNVTLLVGVQDTRYELKCEIIALLLHYMHLVCASWIFVYCYVISDNITKGCIPNLRYNYLFAYGVPAVLVLFFYAISIESYETKDYCWMSLEKGMLLGFMVPGTVLILANTLFAMFGLKSISQKQQEAIANTIQTYLTQTIAFENQGNKLKVAHATNGEKYISSNSLTSVDSSRKGEVGYTEIPDVDVDRCAKYKPGDFDEHLSVEGTSWVRTSSNGQVIDNVEHRDIDFPRNEAFKIDLSNLSIDNLSWKTTESEDMADMRKCLNFALIMQPLFCVFWFMGVVALENSDQMLPPFIFAFLWAHMHLFIFARFAFVLPYIPYEEWCENVDDIGRPIVDESGIRTRCANTTDTIPLLLTKGETLQGPRDVIRPPDSISTISN